MPVDDDGSFVAQEILPSGMHTVEVAVLDEQGNGELYLRDLELERKDWFYVGIADLTLTQQRQRTVRSSCCKARTPVRLDSSADGRLAFFMNGKFSERWRLTASADTREEPIEDLFSNFLDKSPDSLFRRIDPDYHYPTFGDDGTVEEMAPTLGKFYVKVERDESHGEWGNFKVGYMDNELAQVDRGLYGANLHYESQRATSFGEQRFAIDGFAAEPGTIASREEFRGTGGSLYFLRRQDILAGSERVRIELRDKASGLVTGVVNLQPGIDYDIDYLQGRILLTEPLSATRDDDLLVRDGAIQGDEAYLVVRYEYTPGFDEIDALSTGAQGHYWFSERVKLGLTANANDEGDVDSSLDAADVTVRMSSDSWFKVQGAQSEGFVSNVVALRRRRLRVLGLRRRVVRRRRSRRLSRRRERRARRLHRSRARPAHALHAELGRRLLGAGPPDADGHRALRRHVPDADDRAPFAAREVGPPRRGARARRPARTSSTSATSSPTTGAWRRACATTSAATTRRRAADARGGRAHRRRRASRLRLEAPLERLRLRAGHACRSTATARRTVASARAARTASRERLMIDGEVSDGDLGAGGKIGTNYLHNDRTTLYLNYALENERTDNGCSRRAARRQPVSGVKTRLSDSTSVYLEERYQNGAFHVGSHARDGHQLGADGALDLGASTDIGTLRDARDRRRDRAQGGRRPRRLRLRPRCSSRAASSTARRDRAARSHVQHARDLAVPEQLQVAADPRRRACSASSITPRATARSAQFYDGGYTEAVLGYAYRPVRHDRLNALVKYTYFYNVPTTDQVTLKNIAAEFIQKSHVAAIDVTYDLTPTLVDRRQVRVPPRRGEPDRDNPDFFDNTADLYVVRTDLRFRRTGKGSSRRACSTCRTSTSAAARSSSSTATWTSTSRSASATTSPTSPTT